MAERPNNLIKKVVLSGYAGSWRSCLVGLLVEGLGITIIVGVSDITRALPQ